MASLSLKFFRAVLNLAESYSFSDWVIYTEEGLNESGSPLNIIATNSELDTCSLAALRFRAMFSLLVMNFVIISPWDLARLDIWV